MSIYGNFLRFFQFRNRIIYVYVITINIIVLFINIILVITIYSIDSL